MSRALTLALLSVLLLSAGCREEPPAPAPEPRQELCFNTAPEFSGNNAYLHCRNICALGPRLSGSTAYTAQVEYLEKHLHQTGWETTRDTFVVRGISMTNLRARKAAQRQSAPVVLLSCHIDTKRDIAPDFQSADDGASGAAVLLELARTLPAELAADTELIFLDGEESFAPRMSEQDGLYGSRFDVARRKKATQLPRYQINLDMVGGRQKTIAPPSMETSDFMYAHYTASVRELGLDPTRWSIWPGSYMDDHLPYLEAGVDSLNLIADFLGSSWWHTTGDNMNRICPRSLEESGRMTRHLLQRLLQSRS